MKIKPSHLISLALFLFALFILSSDDVVNFFKGYMEGSVWGPLAFIGALIAAVVLAPVTVVPLIPLAGSVFGPFWAGVLSVIGWTLGAIAAYLLARYIGKPIVKYIVPLESIEKFEARLSGQATFWGLVALRIVVPVDVLSFAVGLFTRMPLYPYALATLIGVTPFSFIFSYGGTALAEGSIGRLVTISVVGLLLFFVVLRYATKSKK